MATSTSSQPTVYPQQHDQAAYTTPPNSQGHPQYNLLQQQQQQRQYSPTASHPHSQAQSPSPNSPASPQPNQPTGDPLNLPLKRAVRTQDDPARAYLPAALRPTDPPPRSQPLTPPRSVHGSTDSLDKKLRPSRPNSRRSATDPSSRHRLTATSTILSHIPNPDLSLALDQTSDLPPVSGYPSRTHWKPDVSATICDFPICQKSFNLWERRHHCRHCGNVFCSEHSGDRIPLDQDANFHPKGETVRACEDCARQWMEWIERRVRVVKEGEHNTGDVGGSNPVGVLKRGESMGEGGPKAPAIVAGSVGVGGDWSTF